MRFRRHQQHQLITTTDMASSFRDDDTQAVNLNSNNNLNLNLKSESTISSPCIQFFTSGCQPPECQCATASLMSARASASTPCHQSVRLPVIMNAARNLNGRNFIRPRIRRSGCQRQHNHHLKLSSSYWQCSWLFAVLLVCLIIVSQNVGVDAVCSAGYID
jgi:hypothetical protein